ncbi:MAG: hypothetical protein ABI863_03255 [Ginsengibacter sp.]
MSTLYRYDAIDLNDTAKEEDFLKLMRETIITHFKDRYKKLTRVTVCSLGKQEIFKDTKKERRYIWLSTWTGREDVISDILFTGATMSPEFDLETKEILKKINVFGKRKIINIYDTIE